MWWIKSALTFLLGAVTLGLIIILLHLNTNILVVEVHWNQGLLRGSEAELIIEGDFKGWNTSKSKREATNFQFKPGATLVLTQSELSPNCKDGVLCLDYLSPTEREYYNACYQRVLNNQEKFGPNHGNGSCHFLNGTNRYPVALASFPGSGSTWLRGLLEKVTGVCTGALYCDGFLRTSFLGEGIRGPGVLAVKTHNRNPLFTKSRLPRRVLRNIPVFGAGILLIRDPRNALIAEWHRERSNRLSTDAHSNHVLHVNKEYFGTNKYWQAFVEERCAKWKTHTSNWIIASKQNPFHVIRFEDLKVQSVQEITKLLRIFSIHYSLEDVRSRIGEGFNNFRRVHRDNFTHYTIPQEKLIRHTINETLSILTEHGFNTTFGIEDYLHAPFV